MSKKILDLVTDSPITFNPPNFSLTGLLINVRGLADAPIKHHETDATVGLAPKAKNLAVTIYAKKANVAHVTETHDHIASQDLMYWNPLYSHLEAERKKVGTAMLSEPELLTSMRIISANASCKVVEIEGTNVALISAYFPPGNERSRSTVISVENIMEKLKGLPTILAADFNSIPTSKWYDYQGDLPAPTDPFRQELQEFLQRWGWRDLLNFPQVEKGKMGGPSNTLEPRPDSR